MAAFGAGAEFVGRAPGAGESADTVHTSIRVSMEGRITGANLHGKVRTRVKETDQTAHHALVTRTSIVVRNSETD